MKTQRARLAPLADPVSRDTRFRIEMTVGCGDCAAIPKVLNAGRIVTEDGERVQIMHNGTKVLAGGYHGEWMSEIIERLRGHHEPQEEAAFHEVLRHVPAAATMIELGGFWSYYSLWFLRQHAGTRRAVVVEPDPHHIAIGRTNARLNECEIEFVQASVGGEGIRECIFQAETAGEIKIPQVTVPQLLAERGIATLDVLHCDIQGAETDVLQSCLPLFAEQRIRFCIVSTHSHQISGDPLTHQRCLSSLKSAGAQILAEHDVHESFSGDGLIVAHFGDELAAWSPLNLSYNRYSTSLFPNPLFEIEQVADEAETERARLTQAMETLSHEKQALEQAHTKLCHEKQELEHAREVARRAIEAPASRSKPRMTGPIRAAGGLLRKLFR
jgi:FkbM family methyltransferase